MFPLYIYSDEDKPNLFTQINDERYPNISERLNTQLASAYSKKMNPEEILYYVYAILFNTIYRDKYSEFLTYDFPRIPFTSNAGIFQEMAVFGNRLVKLHLLQSPELDQPTVKYQGEGEDTIVDRPRYDEAVKRVFINKDYYFEGVAPEVWDYQIGGYQVMDKYLKDRKGRKMDDPRHYIHIATAIAKTIEIQEEIDALYPEVEKDVIAF